MSRNELDAAEELVAQMTGWLFYLTSDDPGDANARKSAERKLAAAAEVFKGFTPAQQDHFLEKLYLNPAKLVTARAILVAFGLVILPQKD